MRITFPVFDDRAEEEYQRTQSSTKRRVSAPGSAIHESLVGCCLVRSKKSNGLDTLPIWARKMFMSDDDDEAIFGTDWFTTTAYYVRYALATPGWQLLW